MAGTLKLSKIKFCAGPSLGKPVLEVVPSTVVIFVGPNNSGKSLALREIERWCVGQDVKKKIVDDLEIDFPNVLADAEKLLEPFKTDPPANQSVAPGNFWVGQHTFRSDAPVLAFEVGKERLTQAIQSQDFGVLRRTLSSFYTIRLDGRTRFTLSDPKPTGDLQSSPQNHLWALFGNKQERERVRKLTNEAFGLHFVIDPTLMSNFRIRMSPRAPKSETEEQALDATARRFHKQAPLISELSDGVQAFVGLVSAILSLPHRIMLVDEPEAFLHPTLARRLGRDFSQIAQERNASLIVATHSAEFLVGCLEKVEDVSVIRLTYDQSTNAATARALQPQELIPLIRDPLLRSADVLQALFSRAAVVTEADGDRAFYNEMNRRLEEEGNGRGIQDCLFQNAQNIQTVHRIVGPLRRLGLPAAAIVDLDMLIETPGNVENILDACRMDTALKLFIEKERQSIVSQVSRQALKAKGLLSLSSKARKRTELLLAKLAEYGLFLVPVGELENWLKHLEIRGHGSEWVVGIFSCIGQSRQDPSYLKPAKGDVWSFLDNISKWVDNPSRRGT